MARKFSSRLSLEERLVRAVRKRAEDSANIIFSSHAQQRMYERDISDADVLRILQNGDLRGAVEPAKERSGQKVKMVYRLRGNREAGVVTIVFAHTTQLLVVTVEWEDF